MVSNRPDEVIRQRYTFIVMYILVILTGILLFFAYFTDRAGNFSTINDVLLIFAVVTGMTAVMGFQNLVNSPPKPQFSHTAFDASLVSATLNDAQKTLSGELLNATDAEWRELPSSSWTLSAAELVGTDPTLALAKLRIDLEAELRRIAIAMGIDVKRRPAGISSIARELIERGTLPDIYQDPLQEIYSVANAAIHGRDVNKSVAVDVVSLGSQLLEQLRVYPLEQAANSVEPLSKHSPLKQVSNSVERVSNSVEPLSKPDV